MFDASAKFPPAVVLQGYLHFPGDFDSCLEVVAPGFTGKYVGHRKSKQDQPLIRFPTHLVKKHFGLRDDNDEEDSLGILEFGQIMLGRYTPSVCTDLDVVLWIL